MGLLDAFLLEGYRDPHDVWIALRQDSQRGSGTIDDPYDGGVRNGPNLTGTDLSYDPKEVIIDTNVPHNLTSGQTVTISGVTPSGTPFNSQPNQSFTPVVI